MGRNDKRVLGNGVSRRKFVVGSTAIGSVVLAGCLGDDDDDGDDTIGTDDDLTVDDTDDGADDADDDEDVELPDELTFLHYETADDRRAVIQDIGERFQDHSGVSVNQRVVQEGDLPVELTTSVAADVLPNVGQLSLDVLQMAVDAIEHGSADRVIEEIGEDRFYDNLLDMCRDPDGDGYFGVPLYAWPQLTHARQSVFDDEGLEPPRTWDEWLTAAEALHDPDDNQFGVIIGTEVDQYTEQCFTGFALSNDAHVFSEDGEIVFDSDEMVEALEFYAELAEYTPPGAVDAGTIGPVYNEQNAHLYSGNSFSIYFNSLGLEEGEEIGEYVVPVIENQRSSTYGELVVTTTFGGQSAGEVQASEDWQSFIRGSQDIEDYIEWTHMQVGGFQPVMPEIRDMEEYRSHELIQHWPDELIDEILPESIEGMERFGLREGRLFPEIGPIAGNFMVARAISDVIDGEDAQEVAEETADEMRDLVE